MLDLAGVIFDQTVSTALRHGLFDTLADQLKTTAKLALVIQETM